MLLALDMDLPYREDGGEAGYESAIGGASITASDSAFGFAFGFVPIATYVPATSSQASCYL